MLENSWTRQGGTGKRAGSKEMQAQGATKVETIPLRGAVHYMRRSLSTRQYYFVDYTREGELAKRLRELILRLSSVLGFKVKVV